MIETMRRGAPRRDVISVAASASVGETIAPRVNATGHDRWIHSCATTPTTAIVAPPIRPDVFPDGESNLETLSALMRFVFPMNLTGHPALTVPAGHDAAGLPIGLQLVGRPWEEHVLFRAGEAVETDVTRRRPALWYGLLGGSR